MQQQKKEGMAFEALSSNELLNFIIYETISATPFSSNDNSSHETSANFLLENGLKTNTDGAEANGDLESYSYMPPPPPPPVQQKQQKLAVQGRKKRRRRQRVCKNKVEAETQRMTHIAVERNRRKQMNEHLALLRSLMPESYVQRGDQASIVGGAIEFVKDLEHQLQSLEAKKFLLLQENGGANDNTTTTTAATATSTATATANATTTKFFPPTPTPFAHFFSYPQYTCSAQLPNKYTSKSKASIADIEVTLIETHANVRILSRRRLRQLSKMVTGLQTLYLTILHLNIITLDPLVLYSISAKVEEGCLLNSADDIAGAVHHMLGIIEEESLCNQA